MSAPSGLLAGRMPSHRLVRTIVAWYAISSGTRSGWRGTSTLTYVLKHWIQVKMFCTDRARLVLASALAYGTSFQGGAQNSGRSSPMSMNFPCRIFAAIFVGTGAGPLLHTPSVLPWPGLPWPAEGGWPSWLPQNLSPLPLLPGVSPPPPSREGHGHGRLRLCGAPRDLRDPSK